jgi:hypothetical protein
LDNQVAKVWLAIPCKWQVELSKCKDLVKKQIHRNIDLSTQIINNISTLNLSFIQKNLPLKFTFLSKISKAFCCLIWLRFYLFTHNRISTHQKKELIILQYILCFDLWKWI